MYLWCIGRLRPARPVHVRFLPYSRCAYRIQAAHTLTHKSSTSMHTCLLSGLCSTFFLFSLLMCCVRLGDAVCRKGGGDFCSGGGSGRGRRGCRCGYAAGAEPPAAGASP